MRFRALSVDWIDERCWLRNVESVDSESDIRSREAVSLPILKCEVHCAMSCVGVSVGGGGFVWGVGMGAYSCGVFVEKHFECGVCVA